MESGAIRPRTRQSDWKSATRGICSTLSNRELQLLELDLTYRKQSTDPGSNRELSTIVNNGSHGHKLEIIRIGEFPRG
jgi:hypothetical protein